MHIKYFLTGIFVGYCLCMITGYLLIKYDEHKDKKRKEKNK